MMESLSRGDFYILCPDNGVTRALDKKRIAWAAGNIVENRPPLSRWHLDFKAAFADWLAGSGGRRNDLLGAARCHSALQPQR